MKITVFWVVKQQLANVMEHRVPPSSRSQWVRLLVGSLLQPQIRRFITRHSSFSIDANNLLLTISKYAFKLPCTLKLSYV